MFTTNFYIQCYALLITLLFLLCNCFDHWRKNHLHYFMTAMILADMLLLGCFIGAGLLEGKPSFAPLNLLLTAGKCGLGYLIVGFYTEYVRCIIQEKNRIQRYYILAIRILWITALALNFSSIFNHMYFSCVDGIYRRGPLFWINQVWVVPILLMLVGLILTNRHDLGRHNSFFLIAYIVLPFVAALIQFPVPQIDTMCIATTLSLVIIYGSVYLERGQRLNEKEQELMDSQIAVMINQIQPHFLYNALAVIQDLCYGKAPEAEQTIVEFSEFLRGNLNALKSNTPIPFEKELEHTRNYLNLEKRRFGGQLHVHYDIQATDFFLPALILQPIVEIIVRRKVMRQTEGGTVSIVSRKEADGFSIAISGDGAGEDMKEEMESTQIEIDNIRRCLKRQNGSLTIRNMEEKGMEVMIKLPFTELKNG